MILRQYTSQKHDVEEYGVINTSYATVKDTNSKIRYLFFKLTFEELDKELEFAKKRNELSLIEVNCSIGARENLGRPTTTALENKKNFMDYLN